ncbi:putative miz zinc finger protein [Erysiphe necator]|uniref:Putative miz zinc finger protein n=1 Tax=Uncinula necator TaxID=52586 RepID=A0A0B1NYN5_UNCNE|nr:putative miz zinc finger protein [Erysiphe necator]
MTSTGTGNLNAEPVARLVKNGRIVNRILASICVQENLSKIGVKAELQNRIIERLYQYAASNDIKKFDRLKAMIENPSVIPQNGHYSHTATLAPPMIFSKGSVNNTVASNSFVNYGITNSIVTNDKGRIGSRHRNFIGQAIRIKQSPYYSFIEQLGSTVIFEVMATHRYTAKISLSVHQYPILNQISKEMDYRVMVFGATEGQGPQDIAFPYQSELKVNGGEVKANLRGLKNRPGSTRPVDITDNLRYQPPNYVNNIEMTYAMTNKKYYLMVFVTKIVTVPSLVQKLLDDQKLITEKSVLSEMVNKSRDAEIVATASVLSLKCPLSTMRIDLPCRSFACRHMQCFDATSYLQLQEQGPTWSCPICNSPAPYESLAIDEYVQNILKGTPRHVEQVTIEPDGKWELNDKREAPLRLKGTKNDSGNEVVEIIETDCTNKIPQLNYSEGLSRRPQSFSNGPSRKAEHNQPSEISPMKRPITVVIDLTSSGDEDEDSNLINPPKRQRTITEYNASKNFS